MSIYFRHYRRQNRCPRVTLEWLLPRSDWCIGSIWTPSRTSFELKATKRAVLVDGVLGIDQGFHMGGVFDLCPAVVTAPVAGNDIRTVGDAQLMRIGQNRQYPPDISVRHAIIVEIAADIGGFADRDDDALQQRHRILRQGQHAGFLGREHIADASIGLGRAPAGGGGATAPCRSLVVQIIDVFKTAGGKEGLAHIADGALHAAFLVAAGDRHRSCFEAIVAGEAKQGGMEADCITASIPGCASTSSNAGRSVSPRLSANGRDASNCRTKAWVKRSRSLRPRIGA